MPSVAQLILDRQKRLNKEEQKIAARLSRLSVGCLAVILVAAALAGVALTAGYASLLADLPNPQLIPALVEPPGFPLFEPTHFYDRTGQQLIFSLANPAAKDPAYLPIDPYQSRHLPPDLVDATIASLDRDVWSHPGFSFAGLIHKSEPTIAQRLVADLLLWQEPASSRKELRERLLAAQITARYGREKVIEWYLNSAYFGNQAYGVDAASQAYLGKPADQLSLGESAALAAIARSPAIDPAAAPQAVNAEKDRILKEMLDRGMIRPSEYRRATGERLVYHAARTAETDLAPVFNRLVLDQLTRYLGEERVRRGGLQVITSLDYELQLQAECAATVQVNRMKGALEEEALTRSGAPCQAARLLPTFPSTDIRPEGEPGAGMAMLDPTSGQIMALVGGETGGKGSTRLTGHPPGSLLTPFIYLTAFSKGLGPASLVWDIPGSLADDMTGIENPDGEFHGPVRLRTAFANDYLVPAAQIFSQMGATAVWRTAGQLGIASFGSGDQPDSQLFSAGEVNLLEAAHAFSVFANQGVMAGQLPGGTGQDGADDLPRPATILTVTDQDGGTLMDCQASLSSCAVVQKPLISAQLAYLVNDMMSDEPARWPSLGHPNPLEVGRQAGAKIGQTLDGLDTWTVGYTPSLVIAVWIGARPGNTSGPLPAEWSAGLWHALLQFASQDRAPENWEEPAGIAHVRVCDPSGLLPTQVCPTVVMETFLSGNEPVHTDNLYQVLQVNRETGRLATVFTSPELVQGETYLILPPEAQSWAEAVGLRIPPDDYDLLEAPPEMDQEANISSPEIFSSVSGEVPIWGTAGGKNFDFYRLQAGQGLNPTAWLLLGEDQKKPVIDGQLAMWDTTGLDGLYALQLLVVDKEKKVTTATVQVTVDNRPPNIVIRTPDEGHSYPYPQTEAITLLAEASDNLDLVKVEFYLDNQLISSISTPPFAYRWTARPGAHTLKAMAVDRAGNRSEAAIRFTVKR
jgi:membrane peptidoglycan carboxypeptidase